MPYLGSIPRELGKISALRTLDLAQNKLTGESSAVELVRIAIFVVAAISYAGHDFLLFHLRPSGPCASQHDWKSVGLDDRNVWNGDKEVLQYPSGRPAPTLRICDAWLHCVGTCYFLFVYVSCWFSATLKLRCASRSHPSGTWPAYIPRASRFDW